MFTELKDPSLNEGGRVVRRCWVNFQCRGILLIWIIVGKGPIALAVGAGEFFFFFLSSIISLVFLTLRETARYKRAVNPKATDQSN